MFITPRSARRSPVAGAGGSRLVVAAGAATVALLLLAGCAVEEEGAAAGEGVVAGMVAAAPIEAPAEQLAGCVELGKFFALIGDPVWSQRWRKPAGMMLPSERRA